ncbi:hypothetical protein AB6813_19740 [bacterium RCC_150]
MPQILRIAPCPSVSSGSGASYLQVTQDKFILDVLSVPPGRATRLPENFKDVLRFRTSRHFSCLFPSSATISDLFYREAEARLLFNGFGPEGRMRPRGGVDEHPGVRVSQTGQNGAPATGPVCPWFGMDRYQVRQYTGWYRRITLSMLAHAFPSAVKKGHRNRGAEGLIALSLPEIRHLITRLAWERLPGRVLERSRWRRKHEHTPRRHHYRKRQTRRQTRL